MPFELAQVNVARLAAPIDSVQLRGFVRGLGPVNAAADAAPGFRWRLEDESGDATSIDGFEWDAADSLGVIVNLSVWRDLGALLDFVYSERHRAVLRLWWEWFQPMREAHVACWWVPAGHRPSVGEAEDRVRHLRAHGPSEHAFTLPEPYDAPAEPAQDGALATSDPD